MGFPLWRRALAWLLPLALLTGCASNTRLLSVEKLATARAPFHRVLVLSVSENGQIRQVVEEGMSERLDQAGIDNVVASLTMPGGLDKADPDSIRARAEKAVKDAGADAVLVAVLLHADVRQEYVPPHEDVVAVSNVPYFMGYGTFVGYQYQKVQTPGYYDTRQDYFVQTMLFDVSTEKAVWRAQSKTMNPTDIGSGVKGFSDLVIGRLLSDGMLAPKTGNAMPTHSGSY